jgi:hypothetical protein
MPVAPAGYRWTLDIDPVGSALTLDVPGAIQWSGDPVGRVAVHPCTQARTLLLRGSGTAYNPDLPVTIRVAPPASAQAAVQTAILAAWAAGTLGTVTPPMTSLLPAYRVAIDPSQRPECRQAGGALFITCTLLAMA